MEIAGKGDTRGKILGGQIEGKGRRGWLKRIRGARRRRKGRREEDEKSASEMTARLGLLLGLLAGVRAAQNVKLELLRHQPCMWRPGTSIGRPRLS
jgi:hypothetical protein